MVSQETPRTGSAWSTPRSRWARARSQSLAVHLPTRAGARASCVRARPARDPPPRLTRSAEPPWQVAGMGRAHRPSAHRSSGSAQRSQRPHAVAGATGPGAAPYAVTRTIRPRCLFRRQDLCLPLWRRGVGGTRIPWGGELGQGDDYVVNAWCDASFCNYTRYKLKVDKVYQAVYADDTIAISSVQIPGWLQYCVWKAGYSRCSRLRCVAGGRLRFFATSFERESCGLAPCAQRRDTKRGLAITLARAIIASPHSHEEASSWSL